MVLPTGELALRGPTTQPAVDRAGLRMPRTEGGSLESAVTSTKYSHVRLDLCRVDRLRTNFEMSAVCFEINEESPETWHEGAWHEGARPEGA